MHPLLERQLRKSGGRDGLTNEGMDLLLKLVDQAYAAADEDRRLLERSMELTSLELNQRNEDLERALEDVNEADRLRRQFINSAAHELGTPLTPLKLQVRAMRSRPHADRELRAIDVLERNVDRLILLVNDLLDSAKIQTQRMAMDEGTVDLAQILAGSIGNIRDMATEVGLELILESIDQAPIHADSRRLQQVMDNLLVNACKFTPRGGKITVRLVGEDADFAVEVEDTGLGIAPEDMHLLFQPFSQIHDTSQETRSGTGLGLYISKGIVEAMGGRMEAESAGSGRGSTFRFRLPRSD